MLEIYETWIDRSSNLIVGESGWYQPFTENLGFLFRSLQREYGRCESRVYLEGPDGIASPIGWVFVKRIPYSDCPETYLQETWVTYRHALAGRA